jgi:hypothetical protein
MLKTPPPRSRADIVVASFNMRIRPLPALPQNDFDPPIRDQAQPPDVGLATLLEADVGGD